MRAVLVMYTQVDRCFPKFFAHSVERKFSLSLGSGARIDRLLERRLLRRTVSLLEILTPDTDQTHR
jgi:hypothetical protein